MANENASLIEAIASEAIALTKTAASSPPALLTSTYQQASAAALTRMAELLEVQLGAPRDADDVRCLAARVVVQTWLFGHGLLLLGADIEGDLARYERAARNDGSARDAEPGVPADVDLPSLMAIARRLDAHTYGVADPPRAFQRHLTSFYDEIDISRVEVTSASLAETAPRSAARIDYIRVSLWVLLFLAHDHNATIGATAQARGARALFDRLREATDAFYAQRRQARSGRST